MNPASRSPLPAVLDPVVASIVAQLKEQLQEQRQKTAKVLETMPPREGDIIKLRFGLVDGSEHTLEEIGQQYKLTRERIRQIETKALRKLRHPSRARRLIALWGARPLGDEFVEDDEGKNHDSE